MNRLLQCQALIAQDLLTMYTKKLELNYQEILQQCTQLGNQKNLRAGDLVFFNTSGKGVSQAGIYIGNGKFVHSSSSKGVSVAKINDPYYWGSKYIGAKRVATVTQVVSK